MIFALNILEFIKQLIVLEILLNIFKFIIPNLNNFYNGTISISSPNSGALLI
jgi:hypothetical protein